MNYYNRNNIFSNLPQVTRTLLILNILFFVLNFLTTLMPQFYNYRPYGGFINAHLSLKSLHSGLFRPYQLVTHMFLHGGIFHLFFNMYFGLFMFGRILENALDSKKFFILYFLSGLGAAGLQLLAQYLMGAKGGFMVGASGAIFGVVAAFATIYPNVEMQIIFIPIPIKAKYLVPGIIVISLFIGLRNINAFNIAHFAHVGGAVIGYLVTKFWKKNDFRQY